MCGVQGTDRKKI